MGSTSLVLILIAVSLASKLRFVQNKDALCLDGSPASYYYDAGTGSGEKKFLIFFQGGGWIGGSNVQNTLNSALSRSKGDLGSSKNLAESVTQGGIFGRSETTNPEFYNWHTIFINYCDGTGFQGHSTNPVTVSGTQLYFRGEKIVQSILNEFQIQLTSAETVLISGCSAGGLAAFTWTQYVREFLPQGVEVLSAPDSGIFLNYQTYDGSITYKNTYQDNFMQIVNVEVNPPNKKCVQANPDNRWKCLFAEHLVEYTDVPIFYVQSLYDSWCLPNVLKLNCGSDGTLTNCDSKQRTFIEGHNISNQFVITGRLTKPDGAFSPACLQHCFLQSSGAFNGNTFQVPDKSKITISKALVDWVHDQSGDHKHIDEVQWPGNGACSHLKLLRGSEQ